VLIRFGGHALAAGCTLAEEHFDTFDQALQLVASEWLDAATLTRRVRTDGALALEYFNVETVTALDAQVWGQAFEAPLFCDEVDVLAQRLVGDKHLKLRVRHLGQPRDAIWFGHAEPVAERVRLAYRWLDNRLALQMVVEASGGKFRTPRTFGPGNSQQRQRADSASAHERFPSPPRISAELARHRWSTAFARCSKMAPAAAAGGALPHCRGIDTGRPRGIRHTVLAATPTSPAWRSADGRCDARPDGHRALTARCHATASGAMVCSGGQAATDLAPDPDRDRAWVTSFGRHGRAKCARRAACLATRQTAGSGARRPLRAAPRRFAHCLADKTLFHRRRARPGRPCCAHRAERTERGPHAGQGAAPEPRRQRTAGQPGVQRRRRPARPVEHRPPQPAGRGAEAGHRRVVDHRAWPARRR
jgi:hypothetical protein